MFDAFSAAAVLDLHEEPYGMTSLFVAFFIVPIQLVLAATVVQSFSLLQFYLQYNTLQMIISPPAQHGVVTIPKV